MWRISGSVNVSQTLPGESPWKLWTTSPSRSMICRWMLWQICRKCRNFIKSCRNFPEKKIVNFAGFSNTELKLTYGAPNIQQLSEYDGNFEELITLLQEWASFLLQNWGEAAQTCPEEERKQAAKVILAYAVSVVSDIAATYEKLVKLYLDCGETEKLPDLKERAEKIRSLSKGRIIAMIEEAEKV